MGRHCKSEYESRTKQIDTKLEEELDKFMDFLNSRGKLKLPNSKICLISDYLDIKRCPKCGHKLTQ